MNYIETLDRVIEEVLDAGKLLIAEWERPLGPRGAGDKAAVDIEIEELLRVALLEINQCDFWGEETEASLSRAKYCWVVDPNDGTSDFLNGLKGSAISVALLRNEVPILGVVYAPVTVEGPPDCIAWTEGLRGIRRNAELLQTNLRGVELEARGKVMLSAAAIRKQEINAELCAPAVFHPMPSIAYRLARVAAGDAVAAVSVVPVSAHDVAAGHAILKGAGGMLLDQDGVEITRYAEASLGVVSNRVFGGASLACIILASRNWERVFQ